MSGPPSNDSLSDSIHSQLCFYRLRERLVADMTDMSSVDRASYSIFLKGLYFDSGILRLARWPVTPSFKSLSLVQDPIPSFQELVAAAMESGSRTPEKAYAQPIVFFKLSCLSTFATSPIAAHISNVRLRVPNRSILTAISTASTGGSTVIPATHSAALPKPFPAMEHLDISTTYVDCDAALQGLLKRHPGLFNLVVDRSGLIRFGMAEQTCLEIGKVVASVGISRATEAMKVYRAAARAQQAQIQAQVRAGRGDDNEHQIESTAQRLANTEITTNRRGRSSYATERRPRSVNTAPFAGTSSLNSMSDALAGLHVSNSIKPVILPSSPSLRSLACGVGPHEGLEALRSEWEEEFQAGYEEGLDKVIQIIEDRLEEYHRLAIRAQNATHKSPAEDRMHPQLYRFRSPQERKNLLAKAADQGCAVSDLDEMQDKDILASMDLVACDETEVNILIDQVRSSACQLCTLPDCAAEGRIAFTDSGEKDEEERRVWRRPANQHKAGCAHLVGRQIWEADT